jgi:hypothetical protein
MSYYNDGRIFRTVSRTEEIEIGNIFFNLTFGILFIPFTIIYRIVEAITGMFWLGILLGLAPYIIGGIYLYQKYF